MAAMIDVKCKCCGETFSARVADRKRGWARFCSKRCKAINQEQRTGQYRKYLSTTSYERDDDDIDWEGQGWDAHKGSF